VLRICYSQFTVISKILISAKEEKNTVCAILSLDIFYNSMQFIVLMV